MKIVIISEGETEKVFCECLKPFLKERLCENCPELIARPEGKTIPLGIELKKLVLRYLKSCDAVIALTDLKGAAITFQNAQQAKEHMKSVVGSDVAGFFPHTAQHDIEAWFMPHWRIITKEAGFREERPFPSKSKNPETINHNNPPSFIIKNLYLSKNKFYSKPVLAKKIFSDEKTRNERILTSMRVCAEFRAFLNTILTLSGGEPLQ